MADGVEVDLQQLPEAVIVAYGVSALRVTGEDGVEYATVVLDLQFQIAPGMVAQQSFLMHKSDAADLRAALKNPQTQDNDPEEDPTT